MHKFERGRRSWEWEREWGGVPAQNADGQGLLFALLLYRGAKCEFVDRGGRIVGWGGEGYRDEPRSKRAKYLAQSKPQPATELGRAVAIEEQ